MTLKIAVLVKQVPDIEAQVDISPSGDLVIENRYVCSFFDEIAIECALSIQKDLKDVAITGLSVGGRRAVDALRRCLAMGIDDVEQLGDESIENLSPLFTASVLSARLKALKPDLVICGKQAGDDELGAVGPMVAEQLGLPHVSSAISITWGTDQQSVAVTKKMEGGVWTLQARLPLVVTAEKGLAEPHLPVVTRVMKAMRAKIPNIPLNELGLASGNTATGMRRIGYRKPRPRSPVTMVENARQLVALLKERGVLE